MHCLLCAWYMAVSYMLLLEYYYSYHMHGLPLTLVQATSVRD